MNDRLKSLYQTVILTKAREDKHVGQLEGFTHRISAYNPLCGDQYELQMIVEDGLVKALKYSGMGCSISKASSAVLCEQLQGVAMKDLPAKIELFLDLMDTRSLRTPEEITGDETLLAFAAAREFPERKSCADLSWLALKKELSHW